MKICEELKFKINEFEALRGESPFCQISIGCDSIDWDRCCKENSFPWGFILKEDRMLEKIDQLITRFEIEKKGTTDFKARLKDVGGDNNLNKLNAEIAVISELLVADYLSSKGEGIQNLAAWEGSLEADIKSKCKKDEQIYFTEVKYLGEIPELYQVVTNQISKGSTWLPDLKTLYTYVAIRIVDAIRQLVGINSAGQKRVFILIKSRIVANDNIIQEIRNPQDWDEGKLSELCNKLGICPNRYLGKSITDWLKEVNILEVAYLNSSYDVNPKLKFNATDERAR
ncbi:MAG: hypothetical protein GF408_03595 [Candidatus Omnitrophica bacterium]|nr:hypothetical protein [Candidatus Omnitrophota bacterium]